MNTDVLVVIRASEERTVQLCEELVKNQVPAHNVIVIRERPFSEAVAKTFVLGIKHGLKWTLAVDADVLLFPNAVNGMISKAATYGRNLYSYHGGIKDMIFGYSRSGGPHLYNTSLLPKGMTALEYTKQNLRPESKIYWRLAENGYVTIFDNIVYGLHDYEQSRVDYFRKGFFHAKKHNATVINDEMVSQWTAKSVDDLDFKVILAGWDYGVSNPDNVIVDRAVFKTITDKEFPKLGVEEKPKLVLDVALWESKLAEFVKENNIHTAPSLRLPESNYWRWKQTLKKWIRSFYNS